MSDAVKKPLAYANVRLRICAMLAAALVLTGCSTFKLWYGFADGMIESRAEDYLDFDAAQQAELEKQSAALMVWHKKVMLPKYAAYFNAQADIAETGGWTRPQMRQAVGQFRALLDETVRGAAPFVAHVLSGHLSAEKLAYLEARLAEYIAERRADIKDANPEDAVKERIERRSKAISRFTGPLDSKQIEIIRVHAEAATRTSMRWLENREKRHAAIIAFLRSKPNHPDISRFLHHIVFQAEKITDPEYRNHSDAYWASLETVYGDVMGSLSDQQRAELVSTLRAYAADMIELSEDA